jgi:threonyl-tRNA synthetase
MGSIERFLSILIEHYAGAFPLWLSPVQVKILPITDAHAEYARSVQEKLQSAGVRVELDERSERLSAKIRDAQLEKMPYMLVVGDKEAETESVNVRHRDGSQTTVPSETFLKDVLEKISQRS